MILHQLRCCGVLEVARIARAGFPTRYAHQVRVCLCLCDTQSRISTLLSICYQYAIYCFCSCDTQLSTSRSVSVPCYNISVPC